MITASICRGRTIIPGRKYHGNPTGVLIGHGAKFPYLASIGLYYEAIIKEKMIAIYLEESNLFRIARRSHHRTLPLGTVTHNSPGPLTVNAEDYVTIYDLTDNKDNQSFKCDLGRAAAASKNKLSNRKHHFSNHGLGPSRGGVICEDMFRQSLEDTIKRIDAGRKIFVRHIDDFIPKNKH